jgi:WD40 repeat protein
MAFDVFISYAHEEVKTARRLANALVAARGWSVWWDTSLRTGEQYPKKIQDAVGESRSLVVLWSKDSVTSDWCIAEVSEGWNRKILVPVLLDDSEPPMPFRQTQARNFVHWDGGLREPELLGLIEDIQRVHALGPQVSAAELAEREARRRAAQRKLWMRRAAYASVVLLALAGGWFGWRAYESHARVAATAERLAQAADGVRAEALKLTPEQEKRIWYETLLEKSQRLRQLDLSTLLGIEAVKHRGTERTERALRDSFALLPWTEKQLELEIDNTPLALAFNRDGHLLAAGGGRRGALVWDLEHDKVVARIDHGGTGGLDHWKDKRGAFVDTRASRQVLAFNPVRDEIATAGPDTTARLWDARTGRELQRLNREALVTAVAFDRQGRWLATSDEGGSVCLWDPASGQQLRCMQQGAPVYSIEVSPSSALLATVSSDGVIVVWRADSGQLLTRLVSDAGIERARFDPSEKVLATFGALFTGRLPTRLWSLQTSAELWKVDADADGDAGVAFDATGQTMVLAQANGGLSWWDLATHARKFSTTVGGSYVLAMARTDDAQFLATINGDRELRIWELQSGRMVRRIPYEGDLMGVAVSSDSRRFAVMGQDHEEHVIEIDEIRPADLVAAACGKVGRNLTRNEWRQYLEGEPYRLTCPSLPEGNEEEEEEP